MIYGIQVFILVTGCFIRPEDDNDGRAAVTDKYLIAQCFYAHSTQLLINAAKVLGKEDDVAYLF